MRLFLHNSIFNTHILGNIKFWSLCRKSLNCFCVQRGFVLDHSRNKMFQRFHKEDVLEHFFKLKIQEKHTKPLFKEKTVAFGLTSSSLLLTKLQHFSCTILIIIRGVKKFWASFFKKCSQYLIFRIDFLKQTGIKVFEKK